MKNLNGKVAIITGSDRGIGKAIALRFAREGASLVINYVKNKDAADKVAQEIQNFYLEQSREKSSSVIVVQADVSQVADCSRLMSEAEKKFDQIDILVNNAGVEKNAMLWDVTEEDYDRVLGLNLKGTFFMSQAFVKLALKQREQKSGSAASSTKKIINMSSVHEDLPFPGFAPYCAAKGGVKMLTRDLAVELGKFNITVNAIAPGAIATDINQKMMANPEQMKNLLSQIPLGRMGKADEVGGLAAFLASEDADYVTGSTYFIDGGLTWDYEEQSGQKAD